MIADPYNASLIRAVDGSDSRSSATGDSRRRIRIVLVPGIFYRDYPHTGADGAVLRNVAASNGWLFETIPVDGTLGLDRGAETIADWFVRHPVEQPTVLFSLSKGSAELRHALAVADEGDPLRRVRAWVSVSGLPFGTPSFEHYLRRPLRGALVRALCRWKGWSLSDLRDLLRYRPNAPFNLPSGMSLVQIAALPSRADLRDRRSRILHATLAPYGPNDGFCVLRDLVALPGRIYPLRGADHYLGTVPDLAARLRRLVEHLATRDAAVPG